MKIIAISDLHGQLPSKEMMPDGDVLCICGDIVPLNIQRSTVSSVAWFCLDFVPWCESLPYKKIIFTAGNHDFFLQDIGKINADWGVDYLAGAQVLSKLLPGSHKKRHNKIVYLCDDTFKYDRVVFYGTPWITGLSNWAFNIDDADELKQKWMSDIPNDVDVLITHMPSSLNMTGTVMQTTAFNAWSQYGTEALSYVIENKNIKYAICGHVHSGNHNVEEYAGTKIANVSLLDEDYTLSYNPLIFEI